MPTPSPSITSFISRGRLNGVIRERSPSRRSAGPPGAPETPTAREEREQKASDEALYYRARLILGESLPRPVR